MQGRSLATMLRLYLQVTTAELPEVLQAMKGLSVVMGRFQLVVVQSVPSSETRSPSGSGCHPEHRLPLSRLLMTSLFAVLLDAQKVCFAKISG